MIGVTSEERRVEKSDDQKVDDILGKEFNDDDYIREHPYYGGVQKQFPDEDEQYWLKKVRSALIKQAHS